jgi:hypothetical protein
MLTPTMKVKRSRIEATAKEHLDGWYAAKEKICWAQ